MLICHVINSLNRGGAETHLFDLISEQTKNNDVVKIVAIGPDSKNIISLENEIANLGIKIQRLNGPRMFNVFSYFTFANYLNKENIDLIHSHQPRSDFMIFMLRKFSKKISNIKWIVSVHGKYDTYLEENKFSNIFRKIFMKRLSKFWGNASSVIAISDEVKQWIYNLNPSLNAVVIPYWVNKNSPKEIDTNELVIGFLGRINKNKGIEDFLDAINNFNLKEESIKVNIGGYGNVDYVNKLNESIKEKNSDCINFLGYVEDREEFFNEVDIFVFPSFSEGLGLVLLEAMSYSKICITRDTKPMNTYIDSDTGYLFNNVDSLIQRITLAINDLKKDYSVIEEKLSNIDKKLEKSRVEKIFPKFQEVYKNE
ncbi:MAG: hypothetical protein CL508_04845 [Actinobacteria bacterium]|nr:hypothetical protein [Actinomycetota bacterium]